MSREEIQNIYDYSRSKLEIIQKLNIRTNQSGINLDKAILSYFSKIGINNREDISRKKLSEHWYEIQKRDYALNPKRCLNCGKVISFERKSSDFCCTFCGKSYTSRKTYEKNSFFAKIVSTTSYLQ